MAAKKKTTKKPVAVPTKAQLAKTIGVVDRKRKRLAENQRRRDRRAALRATGAAAAGLPTPPAAEDLRNQAGAKIGPTDPVPGPAPTVGGNVGDVIDVGEPRDFADAKPKEWPDVIEFGPVVPRFVALVGVVANALNVDPQAVVAAWLNSAIRHASLDDLFAKYAERAKEHAQVENQRSAQYTERRIQQRIDAAIQGERGAQRAFAEGRTARAVGIAERIAEFHGRPVDQGVVR